MVEAHAEIEVRDLSGMHAAALRYFDGAGPFATAVSAATGASLPAPLAAAAVAAPGGAGGELVLAWSRPTETLLLTASATALAALASQLESADGGRLVNLTGGLAVLRVSGARSADLIGRLGSASVPRAGEARRGRLADVPVMSLCVRAGEVWLVVDRAYARHLRGWIEATLADWTTGGSRAG